MQSKTSRLLLLFSTVIFTTTVFAQQPVAPKVDTTKKITPPASKDPKPYKEVITSKAISDGGFFWVHKVEDKYYFEIPDSLFNRDILVVNRISKADRKSVV